MKKFRALMGLAAMLLTLVAMSPNAAIAQTPGGEYVPRLGLAGKDVMWLPTPDAMVDRMLLMGQVTSRDYLIDLGSGDGKIAIAAARSRGTRALGLEYNPNLVEVSKRRAEQAGVSKLTAFRQADIFVADFSKADVVTLYLLPELNLKLRPILFTMKPGTRIVSNSFDMQTWVPDEISHMGTANGYLWIIPAHVAGHWTMNYKSTKSDLPTELTLRQRFQMIGGEVGFPRMKAGLQSPTVRGTHISFVVRNISGELLSFSGEVSGQEIKGTVKSARQGATPFSALRKSKPAMFEEAKHTEQEMIEAVRALGAN